MPARVVHGSDVPAGRVTILSDFVGSSPDKWPADNSDLYTMWQARRMRLFLLYNIILSEERFSLHFAGKF